MPFVLASLGIGLGLTGCGSGSEQSVTAKAESDKVVMASADDPAMLQAFARARATLDGFLGRVAAKDPVLEEALVKIKVQDGEAVEYFWIGSVTQESGRLSGIVKNDPEVVHNIKNGQRIAFPRTQIFDWMYTDANSGKMIGNFTACALLSSPVLPRSFVGPITWTAILKGLRLSRDSP